MTLTPVQTFLVYLPYGAVFFAIGVAITSRRKSVLNLKVAGLFSLLAVFAFSHALHEWLEMFRHLPLAESAALLTFIRHISLLLGLCSFLFLFLFGVSLIAALKPQTRKRLRLFFALMAGIFFIHLLFQLYRSDPHLLQTIEYDMRLMIALPATLLTGTGFILYANQLHASATRGAYNFVGAGIALIAYGIFAGAIPSGTPLLLPVEIWRAISAFIVLHFLMYALDTFVDQREELIADRLQMAANSERLSAIGRLAAGIAHEINNPLANASLQLEMLRQTNEIEQLPDNIALRLNNIEKSIGKSSHIAKELLIFAGGKPPGEVDDEVSLEPIITSAWEMASYRASSHQLMKDMPDLPAIRGNTVKLEELFLNLFLNAMDAMPDGGIIKVSGRQNTEHVTIQVTDTGTGINKADLTRVMEPFYTTKAVGQGTGLGLSICYGIMEHHGGTIELKPRLDQQGTQVVLTFPVVAKTINNFSG